MTQLKKQLTLLFVFAALAATAQERLSDLTFNPRLAELAAQSRQRNQSTVPVVQDTLALPFHDDFNYGQYTPDTAKWADLQAWVYVNQTYPVCPVNIGVATFDGLNAVGYPYNFAAGASSSGAADYLTSKPIDLSTVAVSDSVYLSFYYQARGLGNAPEAQDSLIVQYHIPAWGDPNLASSWRNAWFEEGYNPSSSDSAFHRVMLRLDSASYMVKGFRFRFRNYATLSGNVDHWHVDEVLLNKNRNINDTLLPEIRFVYEMPSFLTSWRAMPFWHYKPTMMAANGPLFIRNNDNVQHQIANYTYTVRDKNGVLVTGTNNPYSAASGPGNEVQPFGSTHAYYNYAPIANPQVSANVAFPLMAGPTDSTYYTIDHVLVPTGLTSRDSVRAIQRFYNYYAYDDGTAEAGYGINQQYARLAYRFTLPAGVTDTLKAIQMYFNPIVTDVSTRTFRLLVWADNAGTPGSIIYQEMNQTPEYVQEGYNSFTTYTLDSGNCVVSGTFYIGWLQDAVDLLNIGFDLQTDKSNDILYSLGSSWYTSIYPGALMMRPVFGFTDDLSAVPVSAAADGSLSVYPNPAEDVVHIGTSGEAFILTVYDVAGREVMVAQRVNNGRVDVSALQNGVYLFRFVPEAGGRAQVKRVVVGR